MAGFVVGGAACIPADQPDLDPARGLVLDRAPVVAWVHHRGAAGTALRGCRSEGMLSDFKL